MNALQIYKDRQIAIEPVVIAENVGKAESGAGPDHIILVNMYRALVDGKEKGLVYSNYQEALMAAKKEIDQWDHLRTPI